MTPGELADSLGVSASIVRRWLCEHDVRTGATWMLDDDAAARVRAHFAATAAARAGNPAARAGNPAVCTEDGCDPSAVGRGLCRMHYSRWGRHGSTERLDGADHQRAKTHCLHGTNNTPENTIVYPSDGRRGCRIRRRAGRRAGPGFERTFESSVALAFVSEQGDGRRLIRRKRGDRPGIAASALRPYQLEDRPWSERKPLNHEHPPRSPVRPSSDLPVIVRLLGETHEEILPARAIRWTDTHVMVIVKGLTPPYNQHELIVWLRVEDVFRTIPRRPRPVP